MPSKHDFHKPVLKGTVIHEEKPFIHVLQADLRTIRCDHCYSKTELLRCSGCAYVRYCDTTCQKAEWQDHKGECSRIRKIPSHLELPNAARLLAKIIIKLKRGGDAEKGFYGKQSFRMFKDLMSHYPDIKSDSKRMEHATSLYGVLIDFLGKDNLPNFPEFLGIYGRMIVNGFSILDGEMTTLGTGIYLGASTIDHSCTPNSVAVFSGTTLSIRTIEDIPDYDWSKVRISYVEGLSKKEERQAELWSTYYFVCDCIRCTEGESIETAAVCQACRSLVFSDQMVCTKCNWKASDAFIEKYKEAIEFCNFHHQQMKNVAYLDACKLCLKKEKGVIHPDSLLHAKTLDLAFEAAIQLNSWEEAMKLGYELIPGYRKFYGEWHPLTGLHLMKLGKILLYLENDNYLEILEQAEKIMRVTYGTRHQAYRNMLEPLLLQARGLSGQMDNKWKPKASGTWKPSLFEEIIL